MSFSHTFLENHRGDLPGRRRKWAEGQAADRGLRQKASTDGAQTSLNKRSGASDDRRMGRRKSPKPEYGSGIILVLSPDLPATNLASTSSEQPWA
jgi:hypothetical protein